MSVKNVSFFTVRENLLTISVYFKHYILWKYSGGGGGQNNLEKIRGIKTSLLSWEFCSRLFIFFRVQLSEIKFNIGVAGKII